MRTFLRSFKLPLLALAWAACAPALAQGAYPTKPIRVVVSQLPGGTADTTMRLFAEKMGEAFGQRLIVDNRAGSGVAALTALQLVAGSAPDGYTLLLVVPSFTYTPALVKDMPVNVQKDFAPVTLLNRDPYVVAIYPEMPVKSVKDLVALAKAKPGSLNAGAGNFGSGTHLVTMYFLNAIGIQDQATFVPYKSMGGAFVDAMSGRLHLAVSAIVSAAPHFGTGRLRALAVTGAERAESLPDIPTVAEQGIPGFEASAWNGLVAPAATPAKIVARLSEESARSARSPEVRDKLRSLGSKAIGSTPAEFRQLIASEVPRWGKLVKTLGIKQH